ncbi:SRPBCC domain-containing protein [Chryseobacterium oranimense]|uniref:Activator of Hsp90 ATPase homolog 1-like protein n=1 Tax=Chryseobacterium oranimense TaxID=421058 RepID=A0A1M5J8I4_9FLAO|nr:SRPBCC domain-containing protein [Chryseobacterium oranimense]SHG36897.1 Activator of Hsp90 ATPase homolog 1-like protein [Chryseobacterium oranimense]
MRFFKIIAVILVLVVGAYAASMYFFVDENKDFKIEKEIDYPLDKVFSQFNNLQHFTRWNNFFTSSPSIDIDYYTPYEGQGSAISYVDPKNDTDGEMFIRYENPAKSLRYQLFEDRNENPTVVDVQFKAVSPDKTKITWYVHTPKLSVLRRVENFWTEDRFAENINKSMVNLKNVLGNKVEKDNQMASIKYDSLMVENEENKLLLGINVSASNKKEALYKNIVMNYSKVYNYVTMDLGKKDDEFGFPVLITDADNYKDKEVSYFLGIPLSKKIGVPDNNFSFRTVNPSQNYVMYYKGNYEGRIRAVQQLIQKAKKDEMRFGDIRQTFIERPIEGQEVNLKLSLSVYK